MDSQPKVNLEKNTQAAVTQELNKKLRGNNILPIQQKSFWDGIRKLTRHFPYTEMLAVFLPFYAYLWSNNHNNSFSALLMMLPFIFAYAAGFAFNNILDTKDPQFKENPIVRGELTLEQAKIITYVLLITSILLFLCLFSHAISFVIYFPYLFLCLAYSGLGLRLKESFIGPLIASFIIWVGGPLILTAEFHAFDKFTIGFLVGSLLVYTGRELHHMVRDYQNDIRSGYQTLVVRLGVKISAVLETVSFIAGAVFLALSIRPFLGIWPDNWVSYLSLLTLIAATVFQFACRISGPKVDSKPAYLLIRVFYVLSAAVVLQVNPLVTIFFLWIFFTSKRS